MASAAAMPQTQPVQDDFEGNGTITTWFGDDCNINVAFSNPFPQGINTSATVLEYQDIGGQYANVRFDVSNNYDLSSNYVFSLKIYIPSSGITGTQPNQVSLKLQDGNLAQPWSTQSEIIKPLTPDQWQEVSFDFLNDEYINLDPTSPPPTERNDFNRVVIQVNGENNNDLVVAYIDDVFYNGTIAVDPEFDVLVWSDEFEGEGAINDTKWFHQTLLPTGTGWYNGEIQHYTDRVDNSNMSEGLLHIIGKKETYTNQGVTKEYTSARLNSKYAFQYGKVEVRAILPEGIGTWPAIWTLGKNIDEDGGWWDLQGFGTTPWPDCGEIDIMEHWGINQNYVSSATHTPSSFGGTINVGGQTVPTASSEFHTYTLLWYPEKLVFKVDDVIHYTYQPEEINSSTWPFNAEQYLLLNFAFLPDIDPEFSSDTLVIDYVRVYQNESIGMLESSDNNMGLQIRNFPNPANDFTLISYEIHEPGEVRLSVYDINGRLIETLVETRQQAGIHQQRWNFKGLEPGVYVYTLQVNNQTISKKIVVD
ncbi:MAG: beta-glucanase [Marinilabiliales bacterium]|nr:MAG: beta-glucanase [Marinilabiliales bacterium]